MGYAVRLFRWILFITLIATSSLANADRESGIRALFGWAENEFPSLFSPPGAMLQNYDIWTFSYYPQTDTYAGVNVQGEVWVLGDVFGGLVYVDRLDNLLAQIGYVDNSSGGGCVDIDGPYQGSRMVMHSETFFDGGMSMDVEITVVEVSDTRQVVSSISTGAGFRTTGVGVLDLEVVDDMVYQKAVHRSYSYGRDSVSTFTPSLLLGPLKRYCQGDTWRSPSVTETTVSGGFTTVFQTDVTDSEVVAVRASVTVPAGTYSTVEIKETSVDLISYTWIDIESGHAVKVEGYDPAGALLVRQEATLIQ